MSRNWGWQNEYGKYMRKMSMLLSLVSVLLKLLLLLMC
jgi:hypothetical protein